MLEQLGKSADEVAATLTAKKIRGVRYAVRFLNPIVRYVQIQLSDDLLHIDVMSGNTLCIIHPDGSKEESRLPSAVKDFLDAFNQGKYPELEAEH